MKPKPKFTQVNPPDHLDESRRIGTLTSFNNEKGFGFTRLGSEVVLVRRSEIKDIFVYLKQGDSITYDPVFSDRGIEATNIEVHYESNKS